MDSSRWLSRKISGSRNSCKRPLSAGGNWLSCIPVRFSVNTRTTDPAPAIAFLPGASCRFTCRFDPIGKLPEPVTSIPSRLRSIVSPTQCRDRTGTRRNRRRSCSIAPCIALMSFTRRVLSRGLYRKKLAPAANAADGAPRLWSSLMMIIGVR